MLIQILSNMYCLVWSNLFFLPTPPRKIRWISIWNYTIQTPGCTILHRQPSFLSTNYRFSWHLICNLFHPYFHDTANRIRGEVICLSHSCDSTLCSTLDLTHCVLHLCFHNAPATSTLGKAYYNDQWHSITPSMVTSILRSVVTYLEPSIAFLSPNVSTQCLWAAGNNTILCTKFTKVDRNVIQLLGCWRYDEILQYLHLQTTPLMYNFSQRMFRGDTFTLIPNQLVLPNS